MDAKGKFLQNLKYEFRLTLAPLFTKCGGCIKAECVQDVVHFQFSLLSLFTVKGAPLIFVQLKIETNKQTNKHFSCFDSGPIVPIVWRLHKSRMRARCCPFSIFSSFLIYGRRGTLEICSTPIVCCPLLC